MTAQPGSKMGFRTVIVATELVIASPPSAVRATSDKWELWSASTVRNGYVAEVAPGTFVPSRSHWYNMANSLSDVASALRVAFWPPKTATFGGCVTQLRLVAGLVTRTMLLLADWSMGASPSTG